eukprot:g20425.t1
MNTGDDALASENWRLAAKLYTKELAAAKENLSTGEWKQPSTGPEQIAELVQVPVLCQKLWLHEASGEQVGRTQPLRKKRMDDLEEEFQYGWQIQEVRSFHCPPQGVVECVHLSLSSDQVELAQNKIEEMGHTFSARYFQRVSEFCSLLVRWVSCALKLYHAELEDDFQLSVYADGSSSAGFFATMLHNEIPIFYREPCPKNEVLAALEHLGPQHPQLLKRVATGLNAGNCQRKVSPKKKKGKEWKPAEEPDEEFCLETFKRLQLEEDPKKVLDCLAYAIFHPATRRANMDLGIQKRVGIQSWPKWEVRQKNIRDVNICACV